MPPPTLPKLERCGNIIVLTLTGSKTRDCENPLAGELNGRLDGLTDGHLLLDFSNVDILSSVELGTLLTFQKKMKAARVQLTLFNLKDHIYEIFTVTCLQTHFTICREELPAS